MALGDKVRSYRKEHFLTQKEMASRCGVTTVTISNIERGKSKGSIFTEAKIEKAMERPITEEK